MPASPPFSPMWSSLIAVVAAYLIGSLSFAVIVSRVMGLSDPRSYGSGNPGATNVLRSGNKTAALLTLLLDAFKGWLPVALAWWLAPRFGWDEPTIAAVGLAAFIGHLWPLFFRFKGGKGVATAAGVLLGISPWLGLATLATWLIIAFFFRYSSLAALVAAVFAPFYQLLIWGAGPLAVAVGVMSLLLIWRHGSNIRKLLAGQESRIGSKSKSAAAAAAAPHSSHDEARRPGAAHDEARRRGVAPDEARRRGVAPDKARRRGVHGGHARRHPKQGGPR